MNTTDFSSDVTAIIGLLKPLAAADLIKIEEAARKIRKSKEVQTKRGLRKYILDTLKKHDISSIDQLFDTKEKVKQDKGIAKYRFDGKEWSGNGRIPDWVHEGSKSLGLSIEEFKQRFEIDHKVSD